jgi:hypothetical protein
VTYPKLSKALEKNLKRLENLTEKVAKIVHCGLPGLDGAPGGGPHAPMPATWSEWQI